MVVPKKIVGTLAPLSALCSLQSSKCGTFETAEAFLDWLAKTKQSAWQLLPLHETQLIQNSSYKHVPSPYKSYGIGLNPVHLSDVGRQTLPSQKEYQSFLEEHEDWVVDYALFRTLRDRFKTDDWTKWDNDIKNRNLPAIEKVKKAQSEQIRNYVIEQWQLHREFNLLRRKAKEKDILLIGDIPYYVGLKSPLVWTHQTLFQLAKDRTMLRVSGILGGPKAYFGRQLWGHPLYRWGAQSQDEHIIAFWKIRLRYLAKLFDIVRLDHATGFFSYGSLDPNDSGHDTVEPGPGFPVFKKLVAYLQTVGLGVYAEGTLPIKAHSPKETFAKLDVWGIRIFRYGLNEKINEMVHKYARINSYPPHTVAYTTIHDTQPLVGYLAFLSLSQKKLLAKAAHVPFINNDESPPTSRSGYLLPTLRRERNPFRVNLQGEPSEAESSSRSSPSLRSWFSAKGDKRLAILIRQAVIDSKAKIVIIPIQDWLLTEERINTPGTENEMDDPNWRYRLSIPVERLPLVTY